MVVIVILGVLAALVVPRVLERPDEARAIAAKSDIATLARRRSSSTASTTSAIPTAEQGSRRWSRAPSSRRCRRTGSRTATSTSCRKDPWGRPYQYLNPGLKGEIDVWSFGADGQPGGTGHDADIGSWDL